ncbi:MAG: sulfotransferase [Anaerolineae bacterium]|nr:sulfotransferase [Anaerolineae bacterium]
MSATILEIDQRTRSLELLLPDLGTDFVYHEDGTLDPAQLLDDPNWTLYGLDDAQRQAVFVETPPDFRLIDAPFYYMAQYQQARRLAVLPYEALIRLGEARGPIPHLIFIYSIGRCGSTLLSNIFNAVEGIVSLSEPDVYSNLLWQRESDGSRDAELIELARACTRLLCKPPASGTNPNTYVIKFRNWMIRMGDLLAAALPEAHNLFLYRSAVSWMASFARLKHGLDLDAATLAGFMELMEPVDNRFYPEAVDLAQTLGRPLTEPETAAAGWHGMLERYEQWQPTIPFLAVRYEDLNAQRESVVQAIFEYCAVPTAAVATALEAFSRDSQEGTLLERAQPDKRESFRLPDEDVAALKAVLAQYDRINTPEHILPGTLTLT